MIRLRLREDEAMVTKQQVRRSIFETLDATPLCSVATVSHHKASYIHTAFFAWTTDLLLFFLSDPATRHVSNISKEPSVAVTVFDSRQRWGAALRGLQLFGRCHSVRRTGSEIAHRAYGRRFVGYRRWFATLPHPEQQQVLSRFFVVRVTSLKLLDERRFGEELFLNVTVDR